MRGSSPAAPGLSVSGTEAVVRVYAEAMSEAAAEELVELGRELIDSVDQGA